MVFVVLYVVGNAGLWVAVSAGGAVLLLWLAVARAATRTSDK